MTASETPQIDWSTAEVNEGTLSVALTGAATRPWRRDFERVLTLLGDDRHGAWGEIALTKGQVEVSEVAEGSEADVRHLLESALLQVNSDLGAEPPAAPSAGEDVPAPDRRLTVTFRRFGLPMD
jgi:hypothetical protein